MSKGARKYSAFAGVLIFQLIVANLAVAQELKRVRFGYPSLGYRQGHIWVAKDEGCSRNMVSMSSRYFCAAGNWLFKRWPAVTRL